MVTLPEELIGDWNAPIPVSGYPAAFQYITVQKDGVLIFHITKDMVRNSTARKSDNFAYFPPTAGWFRTDNLALDNTWDYFRLSQDGLLVHHFCNYDIPECNKKFGNLTKYYGMGIGAKKPSSKCFLSMSTILITYDTYN